MQFFAEHPTIAPALVLLGILSILVAAPVAARLSCTPAAAAGLLLAATAPMALTLLPATDGNAYRHCSRALHHPSQWELYDVLNLIMLLPLGLMVVVALHRRLAATSLVLTLLMPLGLELAQYAVPELGRQCELTDLVLNPAGAVLGAGAGLAWQLARRLRSSRPG